MDESYLKERLQDSPCLVAIVNHLDEKYSDEYSSGGILIEFVFKILVGPKLIGRGEELFLRHYPAGRRLSVRHESEEDRANAVVTITDTQTDSGFRLPLADGDFWDKLDRALVGNPSQ